VADDLGLEAAAELARAGVAVAAVADARTAGANPELVQALSGLGAEHLPGWAVSRAEGRRGVRAAVLASRDGRQSRRVECDLLAASAGPSPVTGPLSTLGAALAWDSATGFHLPASLPPGVFAAGRLLGLAAPEAVEAAGRLAGLQAAGHAGADTRARAEGARRELAGLPGPEPGAGLVRGPLGGRGRKSFVCFDEDGTYKTLAQSARAGFDRPELAKRFGGFGLGPGQAGVPGRNLPLALAGLAGAGPEQMGPTTERPPLRPVLMAAAAGPGHQVCKETAMHRPQAEAGAVFRRVGPWLRARYFSADRTSREEIQAVRRGVGLIDVSTLGKFRLFGPDAEKALQRVYISDMSRTREGRLKYSAMLNPDGMLVDDGVVTRLGGDDFYLTTSTGRAGQTIQWLRYHTRHQDWDYHLVNLTDQLAAVNLAGPKSREILARLTDADLSPEAFPFMACREILLNGAVPARALRVGFVGELSYELHFPASYGEAVWGWLMEAGAQAGIRPFGLEAQGTLRLEKGHVIIGQETEQRVNLLDLGLGFLWDRDDTASGKVGAPALRFTHDQAGRHRLTGLELSAAEGAGLLDGAVAYEGEAIQGYVCTCRYSPALDKIIGLALVREHLAAPGTELTLYQNLAGRAQRFTARAVRPPFYDPDGERLRS
jgi:sarcosine oxidase subunit alpha